MLAFALLLVFSIHNFDSIGQDIGRHLKIGEIIWQTKEVPKTNLFSFTEPDFPFVNHHWLSEVIFFGIFSAAGFTGLILTKTALVLATFLLLFSIIRNRAKFWPLLISLLLSILIFIQRTEVRPEMFSFLILAFFLWALFQAKYSSRSDLKDPQGRTLDWLWFLPLLEIFWVNLHIYFFIGPFLLLAFFIDRLISSRSNPGSVKRPDLAKLALIGALTAAATLINPSGLQGALLPLTILKEYGYSIVENQTLSFLSNFFGFNLSIFTFKLSVALLICSFLITIKNTKYRIFEIIISGFFIYAGLTMLRNLPLYALASFPIMSLALTDVQRRLERGWSSRQNLLNGLAKTAVAAGLIVFMILVASNRYYEYTRASRAFGFSVPNGLERAVDFLKDNNLQGPMFNNFDVGGYLIWRLSPEYRVFVDNRPEAYSVKFFQETYKPMQEKKEDWLKFSDAYGINFIFFGHADSTPWGEQFLKQISKNPDWKPVYLNEEAIIFVRDIPRNAGVISQAITQANAVEIVSQQTSGSSKGAVETDLTLARIFYKIDWRPAAAHFAEKVLAMDPENAFAHLYKSLVHAYYTDRTNQQIAADHMEKAIRFGLKESQYYTMLGIMYMNLGDMYKARAMFTTALKLDEQNQQAKEFLTKYFPPPI